MKHQRSVERWCVHEIELTGPSDGNPFAEVELSARYTYRNRTVEAEGFYDGDGVYRIRFMPDREGSWEFVTRSNVPELDGYTGAFEATPATSRGPVRAVGTRFEYADGTPHLSFGTTCYHWTHDMDRDRERETLRSLAESPFNKIRMCVLPTGQMDPPELPFAGEDKTRYNPVFFRHLEARIADLCAIGVEADVILFHPYDRGRRGLENMGRELDHAYVRYVVARLAAFRNVWWSVANEYDFNRDKTMDDWDDLLRTVKRHDPYERLLSIHNGTRMYEVASVYDFAKPWVTHQSIQHWDATLTTEWVKTGKPVVIDEISYEGDATRRWGNVSAQELVARFWEAMTRGGYAGHGEVYIDSPGRPWIGNGGSLHGQSPPRIAFLRRLMEEGGGFRYLGRRQPAVVNVELPPGADYQVDLVDTWNMTIEAVAGTHRDRVRVGLPGRPYLALRMRRV
ncbi:DUF5060 domain-containing protein [Nonomuraea sp. NBC_00507]|uniref:DUF5060 domain-containing protein n=1 Tax=Nonomuraea sp. NBC_00507 TaxID=2976002 RepID=UPI002E1888BF